MHSGFDNDIVDIKRTLNDGISQSTTSPISNKRGRVSKMPSNMMQVHPLPKIESSRTSKLQLNNTPLLSNSIKVRKMESRNHVIQQAQVSNFDTEQHRDMNLSHL